MIRQEPEAQSKAHYCNFANLEAVDSSHVAGFFFSLKKKEGKQRKERLVIVNPSMLRGPFGQLLQHHPQISIKLVVQKKKLENTS